MSQIVFEKDLSRHPTHYFVLLCILVVGLWGIYWFDYYPAMRMAIMISTAVSYVVWGIVHHAHHHDLHLKIVVEYLLVATLAVLIFATMLFLA